MFIATGNGGSSGDVSRFAVHLLGLTPQNDSTKRRRLVGTFVRDHCKLPGYDYRNAVRPSDVGAIERDRDVAADPPAMV